MKHCTLVLYLLLFSFCGCSDNSYHREITEGDIQVNNIIFNVEKIIREKYGLKAVGFGIGMPGGIVEKIGLAFETKTLTKNELRKILIDAAQIMLNEIQTNEKIQPFLISRPATLDFVQIILYNHDKKGGWLYDPEISSAHISGRNLDYATNDPEKPIGPYKNFYTETYEEALEALKNEDKSK